MHVVLQHSKYYYDIKFQANISNRWWVLEAIPSKRTIVQAEKWSISCPMSRNFCLYHNFFVSSGSSIYCWKKCIFHDFFVDSGQHRHPQQLNFCTQVYLDLWLITIIINQKDNAIFWIKRYEFSDVPIEPPKNPQLLWFTEQVKWSLLSLKMLKAGNSWLFTWKNM